MNTRLEGNHGQGRQFHQLQGGRGKDLILQQMAQGPQRANPYGGRPGSLPQDRDCPARDHPADEGDR